MLIIVFQWSVYWCTLSTYIFGFTFSSTLFDFFSQFLRIKRRKRAWNAKDTQNNLNSNTNLQFLFMPGSIVNSPPKFDIYFFYFVFHWNVYTDRIFFKQQIFYFETQYHNKREQKTTQNVIFSIILTKIIQENFIFILLFFSHIWKVLKATAFFVI